MTLDDETLAWRLLETLYELGRADLDPTPARLAEWVDAPEPRIGPLLERLDAQGLVDADRCRLSMKGLVLAVSMHGAQKLARQSDAA
jgi:hypothetical protein